MAPSSDSVFILGLGNEVLSDDAIGPRLVHYLREALPDPRLVYETAALGGLAILELAQGYPAAVFIDAIKTRGGTPGDVYYLTAESFKETLHLTSVHDISFLQAFELGKQLGLTIPEEIHILAIEIVEDLEFGEGFTPPVAARWDGIKEETVTWLTNYLERLEKT
jgi:hydrogenase maturation protease